MEPPGRGIEAVAPRFGVGGDGERRPHLVDSGARDILDKAREVTGCAKGARTSADGRFTVQAVECQGACASAPMIDLDGVCHENLTVEDVARILEEVR